ncbi:MAG TPA: HlyD family secretion protein [Tepidisphaeraceae bacterium]|jgi:membrane fusion protein (multidrug efflux system)|nr:HlyD family secretion protein [Tepidisphaeraceae bacterium]
MSVTAPSKPAEEFDPSTELLPVKTNGNGATPHAPVLPPPARSPGGRKKLKVLAAVAIFVVLAAVAGTVYWSYASQFETTDDAAIEGHVIPISPQVPARVSAVFVLDNQLVKKGDPLVELDPTDYDVAVAQAKGTAESLEGKLQEVTSQVAQAKAQQDETAAELAVAQANAARAQSDFERFTKLSAGNSGAVSQQQLDSARNDQLATAAEVKEALAKQKSAETQVASAIAAVAAAKGDLDKANADVARAEVNLDYCKIVAPTDGRVTRKSVEVGAYVETGQSLLAIVPTDVWVVANFKETQLDRLHRGEPVQITVDAYPGHAFTGKIDSVQAGTGSRFSMLPAENATGNFVKVVQRVPVKITFDSGQTDNPNMVLAPGMSVEPQVRVEN